MCRISKGRPFSLSPLPCENNLLKQPGVLAQDGGPGRSHNTLCVAGGSTREGINSEPAKLECNFI